MKLKIYNTLTRKKEEFVPNNPKSIGMYSCGPTVYSTPHIGNFKATFVADLIRNTVKNILGYNIKSVMNITDVGHLSGDNEGDADHGEDRLEKGAKKEGITAWDVAKKYENMFMDYMTRLNIEKFDVMPRATEHIKEQIELVKTLENKGYTYKINDDGIYMDTSKIDDYGKLMGANYKKRLENLNAGCRVDNTGKKNCTDFALRKFSPSDRKRDMERESPRGMGFPGRHIECSAMSSKYLGEQFDIHHGGPEHITIHHTDEIAQSECAFEKKPWVKYRVHHGLLTVDGGKMGKSLGNIYSLDDIENKGFSSLDMRMFYLNAQYKTTQDFSRENLESCKSARHNLIKKISKYKNIEIFKKLDIKSLQESIKTEEGKNYLKEVMEPLMDDLNTPGMLSVINKYIGNMNDEMLSILYFLEQNLFKIGLFDFSKLENKAEITIPENIVKLANDRQNAKKNKNYKLADEIRNQIKEFGFEVKDGKDGFEITKI